MVSVCNFKTEGIHANILIINPFRKEIEIFEPHGKVDDTVVQLIKKIYSDILVSYTFSYSTESYYNNFQNLENQLQLNFQTYF